MVIGCRNGSIGSKITSGLGRRVDMGWLTHVLVGGFQDVPWFCHVFFQVG